jgi:hypothetical protein
MSNYSNPTSDQFDEAPSLLQSAGPFQTDDVDGHGLIDSPDLPGSDPEETAGPATPSPAATDDDVEGHIVHS